MKSYDNLAAYQNFKTTGNTSLASGTSGHTSGSSIGGFLAPPSLLTHSYPSMPSGNASAVSTAFPSSLSFNHANKPSTLLLPPLPITHATDLLALDTTPTAFVVSQLEKPMPASLNAKRVIDLQIPIPNNISNSDLNGAKDIISLWEELHSVKDPSFGNPQYKPPLAMRAANAVKVGGRAVLAVGATLDGMNLLHAYRESQKTGDNDIMTQESTRIMAAWGGATALGLPLAKASATICMPAGPLASLGCGVVGGVMGSAIGYVGGSELSTKIFEILEHDKINATEDLERRSKLTGGFI